MVHVSVPGIPATVDLRRALVENRNVLAVCECWNTQSEAIKHIDRFQIIRPTVSDLERAAPLSSSSFKISESVAFRRLGGGMGFGQASFFRVSNLNY